MALRCPPNEKRAHVTGARCQGCFPHYGVVQSILVRRTSKANIIIITAIIMLCSYCCSIARML